MMRNQNIVVVTDNHYFAHGIMSLLSVEEKKNCFVWTPAQVNSTLPHMDICGAETLLIVDVDKYFNNALLYFDILATLVAIKIKANECLRILLSYNKSVCMPSLASYSFFSFVNAAQGIKRVEQTIAALSEADAEGGVSGKSLEKLALTRCEYLVLNALSQGQNVSQVALKYQISPKRVSHHKCSGLTKMGKKRLYGVYGE